VQTPHESDGPPRPLGIVFAASRRIDTDLGAATHSISNLAVTFTLHVHDGNGSAGAHRKLTFINMLASKLAFSAFRGQKRVATKPLAEADFEQAHSDKFLQGAAAAGRLSIPCSKSPQQNRKNSIAPSCRSAICQGISIASVW
jgi:hypothetical protein